MAKKINKIVFPLISLLIFLSLFFVMNKAFAVVVDPASTRYGLDTTITAGGLEAPLSVNAVGSNPGQYVSSKVGQLVGSVLSFIGVILLILIIYAGLLWMTSAGNEKKTTQAKDILVSAIIGLVIVLSAYAITAFIGRQLTDTGALPISTTTPTGQGN
ncbi:MAG: hypothetical protein WCJ57_04055 [Candidatus Falkowbacteria bacterium]